MLNGLHLTYTTNLILSVNYKKCVGRPRFVYTITDSRAHFSAFLHSDAHVTQSAHFSTSTVPRCEWKSMSIKSSDADLPSLCATDHNFRHHDLTFSVHCWYLVGELGQSPLHTNMRWLFGCVTPNATSTSYEPNVPTPTPIWIRTEQHVIQWWIWHMTISTQNLTCPTLRCNFPQMSLSRWTIQQWSCSHQQGAVTCEIFTNLHPIPNQKGLNPWH